MLDGRVARRRRRPGRLQPLAQRLARLRHLARGDHAPGRRHRHRSSRSRTAATSCPARSTSAWCRPDIPGSLSFTSSTQDQQAIAVLGPVQRPSPTSRTSSRTSSPTSSSTPCPPVTATAPSPSSSPTSATTACPLPNVVPNGVRSLPDPGFDIETIDFKVRDAENDPPVVTADPGRPDAGRRAGLGAGVVHRRGPRRRGRPHHHQHLGDRRFAHRRPGGRRRTAPPPSLTAALSGMTFDANETIGRSRAWARSPSAWRTTAGARPRIRRTARAPAPRPRSPSTRTGCPTPTRTPRTTTRRCSTAPASLVRHRGRRHPVPPGHDRRRRSRRGRLTT